MAVTLIASPPQYRPFSYRHCSTHEASRFRSPPSLIGHRAPPRLSFSLYSSSSSSSSSPVVEEALPPPPPDSAPLELESASGEREAASSLRGCKACGREEIERGCNGEGRIQGGIATVPGFGWWPIKAYRPCPGFVASGGRYRRQGQSMDEVAFGRGERGGSVSVNESESSKKGQR